MILTKREGPWPENLNQWGEVLSIWVVAVVAGILSQKERAVLLRLGRTYEGAVEALVSALDCREHSTGSHSRRVREISLWLARQMKLPAQDTAILAQAALLHDVGKIGIPDHILLKTSALTPEERQIINQHPELGFKIASSIPGFERSATIVRYHHERFDGSGYPDRLAGEQIPLGARIFAVADVLDAMTSERSYQHAMPFDQAKRWIEEQAGTEFDPEVIRAFQAMDFATWKDLSH